MLEGKDLLTLCISVISLGVSTVSFSISYRQRLRQDRVAARQSLTDTMGQLAEVNLALSKLKVEYPNAGPELAQLRRNMNTQRRYLANHAESLLTTIPEDVRDTDHIILAQVSEMVGDLEGGRTHWINAVEKAPSEAIRAMNLRGYGRFLFYSGNAGHGREQFERSLKANLVDADINRRLRAETNMMWAMTEREFGFTTEANRRFEQAQTEANRIGNSTIKNEIMLQIAQSPKGDQTSSDAKASSLTTSA